MHYAQLHQTEFELDSPTLFGVNRALSPGIEAGGGAGHDETRLPDAWPGTPGPCKIRTRGGHAVRMYGQDNETLTLSSNTAR